MKRCTECADWKVVKNKKGEMLYGTCKGEGDIVEPELDEGLEKVEGENEKTRNGDKTRPWHVCDKVCIIGEEKKVPKKKREGWSTKDTLTATLEEIRQAGVPIPKAIEGFDREDIFPSTNSLKDKELGSLLFKYGALKGYVMWLLFQVEVEYNNVKNARIIIQGEEVHKLEVESEKKRLKEGLEATAIMSIEKLKKLRKQEIGLEAKVSGYRTLLDIYSSHWDTISREISRRSDEIKSGLRQANIS
jgi:hypothetical protein